jgi:hypothetical protein
MLPGVVPATLGLAVSTKAWQVRSQLINETFKLTGRSCSDEAL